MADGVLNGRVSLREFMGEKFDALESKLDAYCAATEKRLADHETRLREQELATARLQVKTRRQWFANAIVGAAAVIAGAMGVKTQ